MAQKEFNGSGKVTKAVSEINQILPEQNFEDIIRDLKELGHFEEWVQTAYQLSQMHPIISPEPWDGKEAPAIAVWRLFGKWIERKQFHTGILKKLDEPLYLKYQSRKRSKKSMHGEELDIQNKLDQILLTEPEYNDLQIKKMSDLGKLETHRIKNLRRDRRKYKK